MSPYIVTLSLATPARFVVDVRPAGRRPDPFRGPFYWRVLVLALDLADAGRRAQAQRRLLDAVFARGGAA
jgi:hypothetical protein